jgi:glycosyltransferase involved in cell wall biosynthesis
VRILYLVTSLGVGGAEKQVIDIAERMAARGHTVALISLKHADEEWPVKIPVLRLNLAKTPTGVARGLGFARKFLAIFRPDILHSHTYPANIFARLLRLIGSPAIVLNTIHNVYEGGWLRMTAYWITGPLADKVTAVSTAAAERFVKNGAVSARKMSVITNGIDTSAFKPDRSQRRRTRSQMQAGDRFIWLAVGRIVEAKDYPNLLRAFTQVYNARPEAELWIAGEGEAGAILEHLTAGTQEAPLLTSAVRILRLRRDIPALLDAADAFVLSSSWEGLPLALAEAMSMEKPVVATDVGGVRELAGDAGQVVPAKDSKALSNAMLHVMALTEKERKALGIAARERIERSFSIEAKLGQWADLYATLMQEAGK